MDYSDIPSENLVRRCTETGEPAAWEEFVRRFQPLILHVIIRVTRGSAGSTQLDDLVQETFLRICADRARVLREFDFRHPDAFQGFLKTIATNVAYDHFRKYRSLRRGAGQFDELSERSDSRDIRDKMQPVDRIQQKILLEEVNQFFEDRSSRDRSIFWLHHRQGLTSQEISSLPGSNLSPKGVESVLKKLGRDARWGMTNSELPKGKEDRSTLQKEETS